MYIRNVEPALEDLLSDDVMRLVMARDGLSDNVLRALLSDVRRRLGNRRDASASHFVGRAA